MTKDYTITKISDQKESKYTYIRNLELAFDLYPNDESLINLKMLEKDKNVAFLIEDNEITLISFLKDSKFQKQVLKEYKTSWLNKKDKQVKVVTSEKVFDEIKNIIPEAILFYASQKQKEEDRDLPKTLQRR